uniref:Uncharacterized protein n=1 Tax=Timema monikensis TaxID=170555 RepID=A0A7R9EGU4_9NEOP|nr:unnamed protein product [Timema monikensis]
MRFLYKSWHEVEGSRNCHAPSRQTINHNNLKIITDGPRFVLGLGRTVSVCLILSPVLDILTLNQQDRDEKGMLFNRNVFTFALKVQTEGGTLRKIDLMIPCRDSNPDLSLVKPEKTILMPLDLCPLVGYIMWSGNFSKPSEVSCELLVSTKEAMGLLYYSSRSDNMTEVHFVSLAQVPLHRPKIDPLYSPISGLKNPTPEVDLFDNSDTSNVLRFRSIQSNLNITVHEKFAQGRMTCGQMTVLLRPATGGVLVTRQLRVRHGYAINKTRPLGWGGGDNRMNICEGTTASSRHSSPSHFQVVRNALLHSAISVKRKTDMLLKVDVVALLLFFPPKCGDIDVHCGGSCRDVALSNTRTIQVLCSHLGQQHTRVENYSKGNNVEEALSKENIPIPDLPDNFVWMQDRDCTEVSQDRDCTEVSQDRDCTEVSQYRDCTEVSQDRVEWRAYLLATMNF